MVLTQIFTHTQRNAAMVSGNKSCTEFHIVLVDAENGHPTTCKFSNSIPAKKVQNIFLALMC